MHASTRHPTERSTAHAAWRRSHAEPAGRAGGLGIHGEHLRGQAHAAWDWVLLDAQGQPASAATHPALAQMQVQWTGQALLVLAPALQPLYLTPPCGQAGTTVLLPDASGQRWRRMTGHDAGAVAAEFLRELTGAELRLLLLAPQA